MREQLQRIFLFLQNEDSVKKWESVFPMQNIRPAMESASPDTRGTMERMSGMRRHLDLTHSYMRMLYKYPQAAFPYAQLLQENRRRGHGEPEYELLDTGVFDEDRYFDVFVEYAKAGVDDIVIRVQVVNRGPEEAPLDLLPTIWFRNTWSWGGAVERPEMHVDGHAIALRDPERGRYGFFRRGIRSSCSRRTRRTTRASMVPLAGRRT